MKKYRILFPLVEAGFGHIMPMTAVADAFTKKYGDKADIIRVKFFQQTGNPHMAQVEKRLITAVRNHNRSRGIAGFFQFLAMDFFGGHTSMVATMKIFYGEGYKPSMEYLQELQPDLIFNTHFATLFYACEGRAKGLISPKIAAYCPDFNIGEHWDRRCDYIGVSDEKGKKDAINTGWEQEKISIVPFMIRPQVAEYTQGKQYYRNLMNLPIDNFTILVADGAYGAGKLHRTVVEFCKVNPSCKITIVAICGKNPKLYKKLSALKPPSNITLKVVGLTDKMLEYAASADLFMGKAGASNLAEPTYFGVPSIVTFRATPVEEWIAAHFVDSVGSAILQENVVKAVQLARTFIGNSELLEPYKKAAASEHRCDGPEIMADKLWQMLIENDKDVANLYQSKKSDKAEDLFVKDKPNDTYNNNTTSQPNS